MKPHYLASLLLISCAAPKPPEPVAPAASAASRADPLPSWSDGDTKREIVDFVTRVTTAGAKDWVAPDERIAVFDNDGTLWVEQPVYTELAFTIDRVEALAPEHPEWERTPPFDEILRGHPERALASGKEGVAELFTATHSGTTREAFEDDVDAWLRIARHPRFDRPYTELVYEPMVELLAYLQAHDFETWIVSGGGADFMRAWTEPVYGVDPSRVIGTTMVSRFTMADGEPVVIREPHVMYVNDGAGKPEAIDRIVAKRPIFAFGNSDGDLQMLQWTMAGEGPRFAAIVHHTDAVREYAYDRNSEVGRLDEALDAALADGWTVVDMQDDWDSVFAFAGPALAP